MGTRISDLGTSIATGTGCASIASGGDSRSIIAVATWSATMPSALGSGVFGGASRPVARQDVERRQNTTYQRIGTFVPPARRISSRSLESKRHGHQAGALELRRERLLISGHRLAAGFQTSDVDQ